MEERIKLIKVLLDTMGAMAKETIMVYFDITESTFNKTLSAYKQKYGKDSIAYDRKNKLYVAT